MKPGAFSRSVAALFELGCLVVAPFSSPVFAAHFTQPTTSFSSAAYLNPNTGRFWTMDSYEGSNFDPISLHKYLYCHANPVNGIDPSGQNFLGDLVIRVGAMAEMSAYYLAPVIRVARVASAVATLAYFVAEPEFRGGYVSAVGGPGNAAIMLCAEIRMGANASANLSRSASTKQNVVNLNFNTGDASDFRVKTADLQRAAQNGDLVVVNNPASIRDANAQAAYRRAVFNRYVNYLKEVGMTEGEATTHAQKQFQALQADHRIDLQVSGSLTDPNANSNLRMLDGSVNMRIGRQLANEIERLGLQPGDIIHQVNANGIP